MNVQAALARVEEAYGAVNNLLKSTPKGPETLLAKRAKKHLRAALGDLIISQQMPVVIRPRRLVLCKN